ncbi:MAG TPA: response regulator [Candidatus Saccharimonadia bacterium]|nr:response regulator [Candidatus Saccharimonadia bacterium]
MTPITRTILIVEDESELLSVLSDKFKSENFEVVTAQDGQAGLDAALTKKPNIILLDIVLPKMDGMTMLQKLREHPEGRKLPVIVLTNLSDSEKVYEAVNNDAYDFLVKADWTIEDLYRKVMERLAPAT